MRLVGTALKYLTAPPRRWVQLSSLALFGDAGDQIITEETAPPSTGPRQQIDVCRRWEAAFRNATAPVQETILLRPAIGIGGTGDPATKQLAWLARFGLAGSVAGGGQWVSWIGHEDLSDLLLRTVIDPSMSGLYHLAVPEPVTNAQLMAAYRSAVGRRFGLPAPAPIATLGLALTGRRCVPARLQDEGYQFKISKINKAVHRAVQAYAASA